jgi:hypothetical protein
MFDKHRMFKHFSGSLEMNRDLALPPLSSAKKQRESL